MCPALHHGCQQRYFVLDLQRNSIREFSQYMVELHARGQSHADILRSARIREEARVAGTKGLGVEVDV
jgi:hypothetical protein